MKSSNEKNFWVLYLSTKQVASKIWDSLFASSILYASLFSHQAKISWSWVKILVSQHWLKNVRGNCAREESCLLFLKLWNTDYRPPMKPFFTFGLGQTSWAAKLLILLSKKTTKRGGGGQKLPILRRHSSWTAPLPNLVKVVCEHPLRGRP